HLGLAVHDRLQAGESRGGRGCGRRRLASPRRPRAGGEREGRRRLAPRAGRARDADRDHEGELGPADPRRLPAPRGRLRRRVRPLLQVSASTGAPAAKSGGRADSLRAFPPEDDSKGQSRVEGGSMNVKAAAGALVVLVSAATLAGTASPGRSTAPVTLKIAIRDGDFGGDPAAGDFVSRVQRLSHGALQLEVESYWGSGAHDAEQQLVRAVSTGKVDLGIVGTRAMDELGVRSFQALTAPLLVDSYPLERAVIASPIPGRMLAGLAPLKLTGLGVLGEGLRKPVAVKAPLLGPDSWRGVTFAAFRSRAAAATVRALGARASDVWGDALSTALTNGRVQGAENDLITYYTNDRQAQAPYVTANVNLWPRTEVVFANAASLGKLTSEQQGWLRAAAAGAAAASTERWDHDGQLAAELCKAGAHLVNASPADLAALRTSLAPVYASLGRDPQTRAFLARIEAMKRGVHTRPLAFPA